MSREQVVPPTRAVFLDRDGTLIEEVGYLERVDRVALFPWSVDAVRLLNRAGLLVVIASNQSGVARGYFTKALVDEVHRHIDSAMATGGARIDAYYYCPHHPDGAVEEYARRCECRKPGRGLVDRAIEEFGIDPARSFVVGDRWHDIGMARAVGARSVLLRTGYGLTAEQHPHGDLTADTVADNLIEATSWILSHLQTAP
jgi:D-glycero-D-manno-heptose 1,7-bisphosphate phosphatase